MKLTKRQLLKSPQRKWDDVEKVYDRILLVPAGMKHESGYMHIAVIGVNGKIGGDEQYEITAYPDDISMMFPLYQDIDSISQVRMDCYYPSGVLQYHGRGKFKVSEALSSVTIYFIPHPKNETKSKN